MLKIIFGSIDETKYDSIYDPNTYFDNTFENDWITEKLSKEIIKDVDKSTVKSGLSIYSPAFGTTIPPNMLSGGVKTLLLMIHDDSYIYNASACGDNCAKWILKIAEMKDLTINLRHIMDFGKNKFEAQIINSDTTVHNYDEYVHEAIKYV